VILLQKTIAPELDRRYRNPKNGFFNDPGGIISGVRLFPGNFHTGRGWFHPDQRILTSA